MNLSTCQWWLHCLVLVLLQIVNVENAISSANLEKMVNSCGSFGANEILFSITPEMAELSPELTNKCYDPSVNKVEKIGIDIFQETALEIVVKFFKAFPDLVPEDDNENTQKRVCSLLVNADYLVHEVMECIKSLSENLEDFTPTKLGITELAAYSESERQELLNHQLTGFIRQKKEQKLGRSQQTSEQRAYEPNACDLIKNDTNLPDTFDLRDYNVVTGIKRQLCGDCYVHATMAAIESKYLLTKLSQNQNEISDEEKKLDKETLAFSRQDPLNCLRSGCDGGTPDLVLKEIIDRGLELESAEPYTGQKDACPERPKKVFQTVFGSLHYCQTEAESDEEVRSLLYHHGPLTVAIVSAEIPNLLRGPFNGACSDKVDSLDHQVLLIGWTSGGYWILKNSYGDHYGTDGFLYLRTDVPNKCGLWNDLLFPYFGDDIYLDTSLYECGDGDKGEIGKKGKENHGSGDSDDDSNNEGVGDKSNVDKNSNNKQ